MEIAELSIEILTFLFCIAVVAGLVDTMAGGGGLIALPALMLCNIPPLHALATNKLQGSMGTATASIMMLRKRRVHWGDVKYLMCTAGLGSIIGTITVQFINPSLLTFLVPTVLLLTAGYFLIAPPDLGKKRSARIKRTPYANTVVPAIGCYDGMFGPGTGSFLALAGVSLRGQDLIQATAVAKTLNFATNIASLTVFLSTGKVVWMAGLVMILGQIIGAWTGSHILLKINPKYLRMLIVCMCAAMLFRYFQTAL